MLPDLPRPLGPCPVVHIYLSICVGSCRDFTHPNRDAPDCTAISADDRRTKRSVAGSMTNAPNVTATGSRVAQNGIANFLPTTFVFLSLIALVLASPSDLINSRSPKQVSDETSTRTRHPPLRCEWSTVARMPDGPLRSHCLMEISSAYTH